MADPRARAALASADVVIARVRAAMDARGVDWRALPDNPSLETLGARYLAAELDDYAAGLTPSTPKKQPRKPSVTARLMAARASTSRAHALATTP